MKKKDCTDMYYDRSMSSKIVELLDEGGIYHWLVDYVKNTREDLDFQTGSNQNSSWFSIYRGLGSLLKITGNKCVPDAAEKYKKLCPQFYENPSIQECEKLIDFVQKNSDLKRYYDNEKEGYYQTLISRRYGILGNADDDFVIFDKEFIFGYKDTSTRHKILQPLKKRYSKHQYDVSKWNGFPSKFYKVSLGTECDFIALTKTGEILFLELKDSSDTQKIYLSPFQIGMYCDIYNEYLKRFGMDNFQSVVFEMIKQKKELGLLNREWELPSCITGLRAALVVGGEPSETACVNFGKIKKLLSDVNGYNIETYSVSSSGELLPADFKK